MYLHPDEEYQPFPVNWFFANGGLLYKKGYESHPTPIQPNGTNLPQDPNNDGSYRLDLPADEENKERVKRRELQSSQVYMHIKPMLGGSGTFTHIACWVYYPFNGPARAKVEFITISVGKFGEDVGDWEQVTLRVSNFDGELKSVYLSEHSVGIGIDPFDLECKEDGNKPVVYSSLHGDAMYPKKGTSHQGAHGVGIRNDTAASNMVVDMAELLQ
ncbi:hypothetical protein K1719_039884 [Acacia pycnantha]|nr:hypothetical protein K1719_039884 [Acacia pycnantha]